MVPFSQFIFHKRNKNPKAVNFLTFLKFSKGIILTCKRRTFYGQLGELAETTSLLRMRTRKGTEGSNPSLSAITIP